MIETRLKDSFRELFFAKRFEEIAQLAEKASQYRPDDLEYRYCAAIAHICNGHPEKGIGRLWGALAHFQSDKAAESLSAQTKDFLIRAALQLAQLAEFYAPKTNKDACLRYSDLAARLVISLGAERGRAELVDQAKKILAGHFQWSCRGQDGFTNQGLYSVPFSPYVLQLEPTNACNLRCSMCPQGTLKRKKGFMDMAVFERALHTWSNRTRELSLEHLVHGSILIKDAILGLMKLFFMGEPLLHPDFDRFILYAQSQGVKVGVQTNGALLKDADIRRRLVAAKPYEIGISVDGISALTYEKVRVGSSWEKLGRGLRALYEERNALGTAGLTRIYITTIVTGDYRQSQEMSLEFLGPVRPYVDGVVYNILNKSSGGSFFDLNGRMVEYASSPFILQGQEDRPVCEEALYKLNVLWDGTVTACCYDIEGDVVLGNCREGIDAAWNSSAAVSLRKALLNQELSGYPLCQACKGWAQSLNREDR